MNMTTTSSSRSLGGKSLIALLLLLSLFAAACGSSDDTGSTPTDDTPTAESPATNDDSSPDVNDDVADDGIQTLDDVVDSLDPGVIYDIVAGQLDPEPTAIEADGNDIRFIFDSGSSSGDGLFACILAGGFAEEGHVLTMVYPDGEKVCS